MLCVQAHKELDASAGDIAELEEKLAAAQRKLQGQEEERLKVEAGRSEQGLQLSALAQDMKALQLALDRVKNDRQQVRVCVLRLLACLLARLLACLYLLTMYLSRSPPQPTIWLPPPRLPCPRAQKPAMAIVRQPTPCSCHVLNSRVFINPTPL